ncbi:terminase small subunit [Klebsiella sp. Ap-873]|nr:terminase small subunit [Klebsiella sp. Ap-873]
MIVNKTQLAGIFDVSVRTITTWQAQGCPVENGDGSGGRGGDNAYLLKAVIDWYCKRETDLEKEVLRKELNELQAVTESELVPGTIDYERHRLTRAQVDGQELKNAKDSAEVVETAFCMFVLSKIAGEISGILDGIPLSMQRRFPALDHRYIEFLKRDVVKAMNKAAALDEKLPGLLSEYLEKNRLRVLAGG